jgi:hypothetical protein
MSILRRPVRLSVERGATMKATVEEVVYGTATVRLAYRGARLTSLPIVGSPVQAGNIVAVDYSAEGQPYVRPLTQPLSEEEAILPEATDAPTDLEEDEALLVARITRDSPYSYVATYGGLSFTTHKLIWNHCEYDTGGFYSENDTNVYVPKTGRYLIQWTVAIGPGKSHWRNWKGYHAEMCLCEGSWGFYIGGDQWHRWPFGGTDKLVMGASQIWSMNAGNYFRIYVEAQRPNYPWPSKYDVDILYEKGKYPIMDIWYLTGYGPSEKCHVQWYWL